MFRYYQVDFEDPGEHRAVCGLSHQRDLEAVQAPSGIAYGAALRVSDGREGEQVVWCESPAQAFEEQQRWRRKGYSAVVAWPAVEISASDYRVALARKVGANVVPFQASAARHQLLLGSR